MRANYDVIVLGLGGIGSGAAYWLAKHGARVLGLEQFELGHARGESHDHSRIIRLSYHAPHYVRLAKAAYAAWDVLEGDAREQLVYQTGGLDLGPRDGAISLHGYADAMRACDVPYEVLDADAIRTRFPALRIGDDVWGLFQAQSGIVAAERATAAHQRAARAFGATLFERSRVRAIDARSDEITVACDVGTFHASALIVAAGPWTNAALAHLGLHLPLEITQEQAMYFAPTDIEPFALGRFPVWIWMDDPSFYGFPVFGETGVVKMTQDAGGRPVDPDRRTFDSDPAIVERARTFARAHLPLLDVAPRIVKTCLYTLTPDRDIVIDTLPCYRNVHVAIGAGHAFKFASAIGRILSDLALHGSTSAEISAFSLQRPILQLADPPKTYMI